MVTPEPEPQGLRARKNRRTRLSIVRAAAELTMEESYAAATIARIAERADVAPRTVSTWFPSKDDILFEGSDDTIARGIGYLRSDEGDPVDRLLAWFAEEGEGREHDPEMARWRNDAIHHDPELRARYHQLFERIQVEVAAVTAAYTRVEPEHFGPVLFAGSVLTLLQQAAALTFEDQPIDRQFETGIAYLRAGLASITAGGDA